MLVNEGIPPCSKINKISYYWRYLKRTCVESQSKKSAYCRMVLPTVCVVLHFDKEYGKIRNKV